jgi:general L-amino acid transport system substrate-binding protein
MIAAEERGIAARTAAPNQLQAAAALGPPREVGRALGLVDDAAAAILRDVGNYGEMFERDVGMDSKLRLERRFNDLWNRGGLLYPPLLH